VQIVSNKPGKSYSISFHWQRLFRPGAAWASRKRSFGPVHTPRDFAIMTGASSKSYWYLSKTFSTNAGMSNKWLEKQGLINIKAQWCKAQGYS